MARREGRHLGALQGAEVGVRWGPGTRSGRVVPGMRRSGGEGCPPPWLGQEGRRWMLAAPWLSAVTSLCGRPRGGGGQMLTGSQAAVTCWSHPMDSP